MITVPGLPNLGFRPSNKGGWEYTDDAGDHWYLTYRGRDEILQMYPTAVDDTDTPLDDEDAERELFGETLDEPLPDDLYDFIRSLSHAA